MDIRNIKEEPNKVLDDKYLEAMFEIGKDQLIAYIEKGPENLPEEFPLNVNIPDNQIVLKDFIDRIGEELMEGYESTDKAFDILYEKGFNIDILTNEETDQVKNHLQNACEEQADAIGFFMTLFLYSNIDAEDIYEYARVNGKLRDIDSISGVMLFGEKLHDLEVYRRYPILQQNTPDIPGFYLMDIYSHIQGEKQAIFNVMYYLNMARNSLKCRPWKRSQIMTKEIEFQEYLVKAFYMYMGFLCNFQFTPEGIYREYFKKYKLNMWRLETAY